MSAERKTKVTTPSEREIATERVFDAPRDRVFAAYTDPGLIPEWWGPRGTTTIVDQMEVRPGGKWRFVHRDEDGNETGFRGTYREISPPERIVQSRRRRSSTRPRSATGCSRPGWRRV